MMRVPSPHLPAVDVDVTARLLHHVVLAPAIRDISSTISSSGSDASGGCFPEVPSYHSAHRLCNRRHGLLLWHC
eukprot:6378551-Amphidinium_carterae.1